MSQILFNGEYKRCRDLLINLNRIKSLYFRYNYSNSIKDEHFEIEVIEESEPVVSQDKIY